MLERSRTTRPDRHLTLEVARLEAREVLTTITPSYWPVAGIYHGEFKSDGSMWTSTPDTVTNRWDSITRVSSQGVTTRFALPGIAEYESVELTRVGSDGDVWFLLYGGGENPRRLGRIKSDGNVTIVPIVDSSGSTTSTTSPFFNLIPATNGGFYAAFVPSGSDVVSIAALSATGVLTPLSGRFDTGWWPLFSRGPDGTLWYVSTAGIEPGNESSVSVIGRILPDGTSREFALPAGHDYYGLQVGSDGTLWAVQYDINNHGSKVPKIENVRIARINSSGDVTSFPTPNGLQPHELIIGSDGNLWYIESYGLNNLGGSSPRAGIDVYRMTPAGQFTQFTFAGEKFHVLIGTDPAGRLWVSQGGEQLGVFDPRTLEAAVGPRVGRVQRFQAASGLATIVLDVSAGLDPTRARRPANFQLTDARGRAVRIRAVVYNPRANTITLTPATRLSATGAYSLTVVGRAPSGLRARTGAPLNGGRDQVFTIDDSNTVRPPGRPRARVRATVATTHPVGPVGRGRLG